MRKLFLGILLLALVLVAVVVIKRASIPPQPQYQGKPLAWWVGERGIAPTLERAEAAVTALRAMGTNCLPYLVSELQCRDSKLVEWAMQKLQRVPALRVQYTPPSIRRGRAAEALSSIAPVLGNARLLELMRHPSPRVRIAAARALVYFPVMEGERQLLGCLDDPDVRVRTAAAVGLRHGVLRLGAITPLAACLKDPNCELRAESAETLVQYCQVFAGRIPAPALSNLVQGLGDSSPAVRLCCATALGLGKAQGEFVYEALTMAAHDPDRSVRVSALAALTLLRSGTAQSNQP